MLIIRDLMFKQARFYTDFLNAGEGISTNILADRLSDLQREGIVRKTPDPGHGSRFIYSLTEKGLALVPVMLEIMDWAETWDEDTQVPGDFILALRRNRRALAKKIVAGLNRADGAD